MRGHIWIGVAAVASAGLFAGSQARACSMSDFAITQSDWRREIGEYARIVGEIANQCATPSGAQLQAVFRDKAGKVVITSEFWPASTRNIGAGQKYAFSTLVEVGATAATMSVSIIDAREW